MSSPTFENLDAVAQSAGGHIVQPQAVGKYIEVLMSMKGPTAYVTGGVTLIAKDMELTWLNFVKISISLDTTTEARIIYPDNDGPSENVKIMFLQAGTEVANATDLSSKKFRLNAQGAY